MYTKSNFLCTLFSGTTLTLKGEFKYQHYGEIYEDIDMRAEVGLLTRYHLPLKVFTFVLAKVYGCRNIWIHGQVKDKCADEDSDDADLNDCNDIMIDTFGGHTKSIRGFKVGLVGQLSY